MITETIERKLNSTTVDKAIRIAVAKEME